MNQHGDHGDSSRRGEVKSLAHDARNATTVDIWTINDLVFSGEDQHLTWFCISTIENATDNFDTENKLGEGGFGPVYKVKYHHVFICLDLLTPTHTSL